MMDISSQIDRVLGALGEQLGARSVSMELVVCGGAALVAVGLIQRPTKDVDVLARLEGGTAIPAVPEPGALTESVQAVARDFGLPDVWLNPGPTSLVRLGLPAGFETRLDSRTYPGDLTVHFIGRLDQIHLKLYAMVNEAGARHEADLRALTPTRQELLAAARWTITHDASPGFRDRLRHALRQLGVSDAAELV